MWVWYAIFLALYGIGVLASNWSRGEGLMNSWSAVGVVSLLGAIACLRIAQRSRILRGAA